MKGFIYIIRSHQTDDVYYGSTTQMLCKRMANHRACYKCWLNGDKPYVSSYEILQYEDAYIEIVEEVNFENKQELTAKEGHYIRENNCVNKVIPCRTIKEYQEVHKDKLKVHRKEWIKLNKDEISKYNLVYREEHKDKIKEQQRQYNKANRDIINENKRKYRASKKVSPEQVV